MNKTTNTLERILKETKPSQIDEYLKVHEQDLLPDNKPFAQYMRLCIKEKGMQQQEVFIRADMSEGYGYKIISEEKHTRQRDTILRLCIGARFSLEETQRALKIYGMAPLYSRVRRDALLINVISNGNYDISEINEILVKHQLSVLKGTENEE